MHRCLTSRIGRVCLLALLAGAAASPRALAEVRLPNVFGSHMVLQRDAPLPVWGWDQPGETVTVLFDGARATARANDQGEWKATLPARRSGGPHVLTVQGSSTVRLTDVLVGEVWLASGQSNMEMGIASVQNGAQEVAAADHPRIRLLMVPNEWKPLPQTDQAGTWKVCTPKTVAEGGWGGFSAAAYFFGRELQRRLNVPVGLIDATWGGTVIQTWTPPEGFAAVPALQKDYERVLLADPRTPQHRARLEPVLASVEKWAAETRKAAAAGALSPEYPAFPDELRPPRDVQHATALYNGMIAPIVPYAIRGAIWYQGESNLAEGPLYTERMKALVGGWRKLWGGAEFPFYYVQVAPFNYGSQPRIAAEFWEAQTAAQAIPNTGMAVINDVGNLADIHPANKQDVGKRLALWALARTYGVRDLAYQGPTFREFKREGAALRVSFDNAAGLRSRDGKPLTWFEVIDADEGGFVKAEARIDGNAVLLTAPGVKNPVALRYAWHMLAEPNLTNGAGLPAGAFRAGDVPDRDLLDMNVPEAKGLQLVYDLDLGKLGADPAYTADYRARIARAFDRVAYFIELQREEGQTDYLYVSMDAFTDDPGKIGIPTLASGARFQRPVGNLNVVTNVQGVVAGEGIDAGCIEFWPDNYGPANGANVPGASAQAFDFGDQPGDPRDGYGCMQVHNYAARQTLLAVNNWKAGAGADLGIGNRPRGAQETQPDWTFAANAGTYQAKRLRVLVRLKQP